MNLTDELRKLAALRTAGHLTGPEFAQAKQRLLSGDHGEPSLLPGAGGTGVNAALPLADKTFQSSRWSSGNLFFPDTLTLADDGLLFRKDAMFGSSVEHINYRAVASFRIKAGLFLATVCIETSGGSQPIFVNGLWKSEAREIEDTIRAFQKSA